MPNPDAPDPLEAPDAPDIAATAHSPRRLRPRSPKGRARETGSRLAQEYPGSAKDLCALDHDSPFQLLVATILSAQCTDERVNMVTPAVFARCPTPTSMAAADPTEMEELIRPTGFFRNKTKSLLGMATALEDRFGGEVPTSIEDLTSLPGVGRKTANVIRSVDFGLPGLPVDTHVGRLGRRLGLTTEVDPVKAEYGLNALVPAAERGSFSLRLILHGRQVCLARTPRCDQCLLADFCPSSSTPTMPRRAKGRTGQTSRATQSARTRQTVRTRRAGPGVSVR